LQRFIGLPSPVRRSAYVELQIRSLPLVELLLGEVLLGVVGRLVGVSDVSGSGSDQFVDLVGVLEL